MSVDYGRGVPLGDVPSGHYFGQSLSVSMAW
jgi:hypothetical protein